MPTYVSPFTGTVVQPTDVSYYALTFSTNQQLYWPAVVNPTQVPAARIMDCTANAASLTIALPQANQGTLGSDILIRNKGSNTFVVTDFSGGNTVSIAAGASRYFYLTDNSTAAGIWQNVAFGVGTSSADAATLAGYGLTTTIQGKLATTGNIIQTSTTPTFTEASRAATYVWTSGAGTFTLPASSTFASGWFISFRNAGTGNLTIATTSPSTINGQGSIITNPGDSGYIFFDSSTGNFFTVGWNAANNISFSAGSYDVDSISGSTYSLVAYAPNIQTYVALSGTRSTSLTITLPNITQMYVLISNIVSSAYALQFNVSGSSSPAISLTAGQVKVIVVDNGIIYTITQSTTSLFYANNGSASTPAFSFTNDINTGMYLQGTSILGLAANSTQMLKLDNTNTSSPQVSTVARITATGGIAGGTF